MIYILNIWIEKIVSIILFYCNSLNLDERIFSPSASKSLGYAENKY